MSGAVHHLVMLVCMYPFTTSQSHTWHLRERRRGLPLWFDGGWSWWFLHDHQINIPDNQSVVSNPTQTYVESKKKKFFSSPSPLFFLGGGEGGYSALITHSKSYWRYSIRSEWQWMDCCWSAQYWRMNTWKKMVSAGERERERRGKSPRAEMIDSET